MVNLDSTILLQQKNFYDSYLKITNNPRYKKTWNYILKNTRGNEKILDIGCANGEFSEKLVIKGYDCYGLEFMEKAIKESTAKGIKVVKGSFLDKFPFKENTFDIVFAGEVIEHTFDDGRFIKELHRVLKPGGLLIITTPNLVSLGNRLLMILGKLPRFAYSEFHYRIYNAKLIKAKLLLNNFEIKKFESSYILISTFFNKPLGVIGEFLGSKFPNFGENFIIYARKK